MRSFLILSFMFCTSLAFANDGAAGLDGGDLHFKNLKGVQMEQEDLSISPTFIKVSYKFKNTTDKDITTLISFPIEGDLSQDRNWDMESKNPNEFTVMVDGKVKEFKTKITENKEQLSMRFNHYWEQTFPAQKTIEIIHTYKPIFGSSALDGTADNASNWTGELEKKYCASKDEIKSVQKKKYKLFKPLTYIVMTAKTWDGPIGQFHLTLDKGKFDLLFLCTDLKLQKNEAGLFETTVEKYIPTKDLEINFVGNK